MSKVGKRTGNTVPGYTPEMGDRINRVVMKLGTQKAAADLLGVRPETVAAWRKGEQKPSLYDMITLCQAAGESITWLATGEGPRDSPVETSQTGTEQEHGRVPVLHVAPSEFAAPGTFVSVPMLDVQASAGLGLIAHGEEVKAYVAMEAAFLRSLGINPGFARIVDVSGDSMYPTLRDSDRIVVDTSIDHVADEGLYAVVLGNALVVKRLQIRLDGSIVLRSDNKAAGYEDIVVEGTDLERLRIVGRVKIRIHLM